MATRALPLRVRRSPTTLLASAALLLAVSACAANPYTRAPSPENGANSTRPALVYVENKGFDDLTIYFVRNTAYYRIGWVSGYSKRVFKVDPNILGTGTGTRIVAQLPGESVPRHTTQIFDLGMGTSIYWVILDHHDMTPAQIVMPR